MSNLTKVFIVLVTVLAVILVAVVVTFVAGQENLKEEYEKLRTSSVQAQEAAQSARRELEEVIAARDEQIAAETDRAKRLQDQFDEAQTNLAQHLGDRSLLQSEIGQLKAQSVALTSQGSTLAALTQQQLEELTALRSELDRSRLSLIEITDDRNAQATQVDVLTQQVRDLQERMTPLLEQNRRLEQVMRQNNLTITSDSTEQQPFESTVAIYGQITAVQEAAGDTYVQVNVGSNDGVQPNMKFIVFRQVGPDARYVGSVVIERVDAAESSGRIRLSEEPIVTGYQVVSGVDRQ